MKILSNLLDNPCEMEHAPSGITALLLAPTASGKTTVASKLTTDRPAMVVGLGIGEGGSTIQARRVVYSNALEQHIVVSVKQKKPYVSLLDFIQLVTSRMAVRISNYYKKLHNMDEAELKTDIENDLKIIFTNTINTKAQYNLLSEEQRFKAVELLSQPFAVFLKNNGFEIYNHASNSLDVNEAKKYSKKLKEAINDKIHSFIQSDSKTSTVLNEVYSQLNESLDEYFFSFFDINNISKDGYYFYIIDVNSLTSHKDFITAFFSNNNIQQGKQLSLEVLCEDIVIHLPMSQTVIDAIMVDKAKHKVRSVFEDVNGYFNFTLIDTRGLYHAAADEDIEQDHLEKLLYHTRYDAIICLTPMHGNANGTKFEIQMTNELSKFKKNVPVVLLCNKADEYADSLQKGSGGSSLSDLFGEDVDTDTKNVCDEVMERAEKQTQSIEEALNHRKQGKVFILPAMFKDPVSEQDRNSLVPRYGENAVVRNIIDLISENQENTGGFIKFNLSTSENTSWTKHPAEVNEHHLFQLLNGIWCTLETKKQVKDPAIENIAHNQGRRPQGNGFNALVRRLQLGEGWDSNIKEYHYKNHDSFHVQFPSNLANLISPALISQLVESAVDYYGDFENTDHNKRFVTMVIKHFVSKEFVSDVLYHQIFSKLMKILYTNQSLFDGLLSQTKSLFQLEQSQFDSYSLYLKKVLKEVPEDAKYVHILVIAIKDQLEIALSHAFNKHVYLG